MNLAANLMPLSVSDLPYRARYKASFAGTQADLLRTLNYFLQHLGAQSQGMEVNAIEHQYEMAAQLVGDGCFELLIYWPEELQGAIELTFDLDAPVPFEGDVDPLFLHPACQYFPSIRQVYNYLGKPKVTVHSGASTDGIEANHRWLDDHRQDYQGRWVALRQGNLVVDAGSARDLLKVLDSTENTLLTVVY
jgi:hypothetical protein